MNGTQILKELAAELGQEYDVVPGKWFGKLCLKVDGKVFAALWGEDIAFKLAGRAHREALEVEGAHRFDPRGQGHPMKEWVQVPAAQSSTWGRFARLACDCVAGAAQAEKDRLIAGLVSARCKILDSVNSLPPKAQDEVFLGDWSVQDLLAHLIGWDHTNRTAVEEIRAGQKPSFWAQYDRDWQSYNAQLVAEYRLDDFSELVAAVEHSHRELIDYLQAVPTEEYLRRRPIGTLLRAEASDEEDHNRQIQEFASRAGGA